VIDINTAGVDDLCSLPGIGPARAEAIVAYRLEHGPFTSVERIMDVPGIGPSLFEGMRSRLAVE
ncbi:MAG TPA: helix-hairpin-helix domain-containing protein, partial [Candidatus Fermentibacter sp.]|nr:helix-hairpin-helix domain-containing protein [Candidatus Fermentibacter sp.]